MENRQGMSIEAHQKVVAPFKEEAFALNEKEVEAPQIPRKPYLEEVRAFARRPRPLYLKSEFWNPKSSSDLSGKRSGVSGFSETGGARAF